MPPEPPLLELRGVSASFRSGGWLAQLLGGGRAGLHRAVDQVSLTLGRGETLGIVGESGSGKTTLGRAILRLQPVSAGQVILGGQDITALSGAPLRRLRRRMQMVFQDPLSSFNPRHSIGAALATPLRVHRLCARGEVEERVTRMLGRVGLPPAAAGRYPHELSGGQVQRAAIGRALLMSPDLLLADEAVSKLDVSVRAQILNLLRDLQEERGTSMIFITHDWDVASFLSQEVMVMYFGQVVERGRPDVIARAPLHPYTQVLMGAEPAAAAAAAAGQAPAAQTGCRFYARCSLRMTRCLTDKPPLEPQGARHAVACWAVGA